jgi:hypothetical protein
MLKNILLSVRLAALPRSFDRGPIDFPAGRILSRSRRASVPSREISCASTTDRILFVIVYQTLVLVGDYISLKTAEISIEQARKLFRSIRRRRCVTRNIVERISI